MLQSPIVRWVSMLVAICVAIALLGDNLRRLPFVDHHLIFMEARRVLLKGELGSTIAAIFKKISRLLKLASAPEDTPCTAI